MITEDYVSFETAKLLKEKGFELPSLVPEEWVCSMYDEKGEVKWGCYSDNWYCRITLQMAMKWLREVHNIAIETEWEHLWYAYIKPMTSNPSEKDYYQCESSKYEEACEEAIKYYLENII